MVDREQQIRDTMEALGMTRDEAEAYVAIERGEVDGDIEEIDKSGGGNGGDR